MITKTKPKKTTTTNDSKLRSLVTKELNKQLGGSKATKADVDDALKFIKPRMKKHVNLWAFSNFSPVEMAVSEYIHSLFD